MLNKYFTNEWLQAVAKPCDFYLYNLSSTSHIILCPFPLRLPVVDERFQILVNPPIERWAHVPTIESGSGGLTTWTNKHDRSDSMANSRPRTDQDFWRSAISISCLRSPVLLESPWNYMEKEKGSSELSSPQSISSKKPGMWGKLSWVFQTLPPYLLNIIEWSRACSTERKNHPVEPYINSWSTQLWVVIKLSFQAIKDFYFCQLIQQIFILWFVMYMALHQFIFSILTAY